MLVKKFDADGTRLTDCCGAHSTFHDEGDGETFVLCCKDCWNEVEPGEGDGSEDNKSSVATSGS